MGVYFIRKSKIIISILILCLGMIVLGGVTYAAEDTTTNDTSNILQGDNQSFYSNQDEFSSINASETSYASGLSTSSGDDPNRIGSSYPTSNSLPHTGTPKMVVLLIDFPDYPHSANQTVQEMQSLYFGDGSQVTDPNKNPYPYESLHNWYQRSSYGALNITGDVYGWYTAKNNREYYAEDAGREKLIKEAITYYDPIVDFSKYDNTGDGVIEGLAIKWTGPLGEWSSLWWPYMTNWYLYPIFNVDGVKIGNYTWENYSPNIKVDIHETGHLMGLPDLYDYDTQVDPYENKNGPGWGIGGMDMMDDGSCDFNCFFKLLFGWITPYYVNNTSAFDQKIILNAMEKNSTHNCVVICNGNFNLYGNEFYMAEYRTQTGNDKNIPADGLYIWHIDTTLGDDGRFYYDNTGTVHNLIDLIQADGLFDIQNGTHSADAADIYAPPYYLSPTTTPNSNWYNGTSGIYVYNINNPGNTISAFFGWDGPINIGLAVGNQVLNWTTGGSNNKIWLGIRDIGQNDTVSAQSGYINDAENTWMSTIVEGPGYLNFDWKISSEEGCDFLKFFIDGVEKIFISGELDWQHQFFTLTPGTHVLNWTYNKNTGGSTGSDCGWVDNVSWLADNSPPTVESIDPSQNGASNVIRKIISITFNEDVVGGSAFEGISVSGPSGAVDVTKSITGNILRLIPTGDFTVGVYTVNIPAAALRDRLDNVMETPFSSIFTIDTYSPIINAIVPADGVKNPDTNLITITFNEDVVGGSAFEGISVSGPGGDIFVIKSILGQFLRITPVTDFSDGDYIITIPANSLNDKAGNSLVSTFTSRFNIDKKIPQLWASTPGGFYNTGKLITLNMDEPGTIYYTIDGSVPTVSSLKYSGPITIASTTILKFFGVDEMGNPSNISSQNYIIDKTAPTTWTNLKSGLFNTNKVVMLNMSEKGMVYYTIDGSVPTVSSLKYSGPITIASTTILKFFAVDKAGNPSTIKSVTYNIDKKSPRVVSTSPKRYAKRVSRTKKIYIRFSEKIRASTRWSKIYVKNKRGKKVSIKKWISGNVLYIQTKKRSAYSYYTVYIPAYAIKDRAGNKLLKNYSLKFKTGR